MATKNYLVKLESWKRKYTPQGAPANSGIVVEKRISVYDVSDPKNPIRVADLKIPTATNGIAYHTGSWECASCEGARVSSAEIKQLEGNDPNVVRKIRSVLAQSPTRGSRKVAPVERETLATQQ